ncbi:MAG TPA: phosphoethanolamine--lipid A transferase [Rubrivivax sp.]
MTSIRSSARLGRALPLPRSTHPGLSFDASPEAVLIATSLFWVLAANGPFFSAALKDRAGSDVSTWGFGLALALMLVALNLLILVMLASRWTLKPTVATLLVGTAFATHFMQQFGVYLDPSMLRNVLRTDPAEASELFTWSLLPHLLLYAGLPLWLLWHVRIVARPWRRALLVRAGVVLIAAATVVGALLAVFQPFASLMRNEKALRYLITPANVLWSAGALAATEMHGAAAPRRPIGLDAVPGPSWAARKKPMLLVLVVGETARAANWQLSGYMRETTPALAKLPDLINFPQVSSCGTQTETSLPCMFAPVGRRDYDEARIRGSQSLLHVLARAGVGVQWLDNQSGCKGVCEGLPTQQVSASNLPGQCEGGHCLDEGLLQGLGERLKTAHGSQLLVLHQLGNHGPAYFRRYPPAFAKFQPACEHDDLRRCSREEIVNAYDNALRYTDHVLAELVGGLQHAAGEVDSALIYVSDHGESLGESNLFLHGMPYAIAPEVQTHVPMVMWLSEGFSASTGVTPACLRRRAGQPARHDHLFHTVMGLLDVRSAVYEPAWDLVQDCRQ